MELQVQEAYREGMEALESGDVLLQQSLMRQKYYFSSKISTTAC